MKMSKLGKNKNETKSVLTELDQYFFEVLKKDAKKLLLQIEKVETEANSSEKMTIELLSFMADAEDTYAKMMRNLFTISRRLGRKQQQK